MKQVEILETEYWKHTKIMGRILKLKMRYTLAHTRTPKYGVLLVLIGVLIVLMYYFITVLKLFLLRIFVFIFKKTLRKGWIIHLWGLQESFSSHMITFCFLLFFSFAREMLLNRSLYSLVYIFGPFRNSDFRKKIVMLLFWFMNQILLDSLSVS